MISCIFPSSRARSGRRGFTLIESALVTTIISVGVLAMLQLLATGTSNNQDSTDLTTATNLARNIRELTLGLSFSDPTTPSHWGPESGEALAGFDDLDDLDGQSFSPPIDARRQSLANMSAWRQTIAVDTVDPDLLTAAVPKGSAPANRITVTIRHHERVVCTTSWVRLDTSLP